MNTIEQFQNVKKKMIQDEIDLNARNKFNSVLSKIGMSDEKMHEMNSMLDDIDKQMAYESYKTNYEK
ncbi:hypothetical protein WKH56_19685 [Priestia sp. SB1]|uniref:hypothetical protein n=1 Tax=Priestia sp. SB1 TaxID=3132359 RepID=UPI0031792AD1